MRRDFNSFKAVESKKLRDVILKYNPNIYLNMHGWYDEVLGTKKLNGIIMEAQGLTTRKDGKYGRTVYIKNNGDLRFNTRIPRGSEEYKRIYKERTACERVNNRVLNDYCLQSLKIRGIDHFSFWTMLIGICIHLDARCKTAALN